MKRMEKEKKRKYTNSQIKLRLPNITPRIRRLHHHLLPLHRPTRKRQLIASATAWVPRAHGREAVGQVFGHGPGRLVAAHVGAAAGAARLDVGVGEGLVFDVAGLYGGCDAIFAGPGAGGFAAVPVWGREISLGCGERDGEGRGSGGCTSSGLWCLCRIARRLGRWRGRGGLGEP